MTTTVGELLRLATNANPDEFTPVGALADWCDEQGWTETAAMVRTGMCHIPVLFNAYGDGDGDGGGYGSGSYDGYGDGGSYGHGDGTGGSNTLLSIPPGVTIVERGLRIICSPGGHYPYVRIGWCERNDIWVLMRNCRVIRRFGNDAQLARLAKSGPVETTQLLELSDLERVCVAACVRVIDDCAPEVWEQSCPKPEGW